MNRPQVDPSSFYRLNEEVAAELARLDREGALDRLKALLEAGRSELWVSSARPREGLEEPLGVLRPGAAPDGARAAPRRPLEPAAPVGDEPPACSCGPGEGGAEPAAAAAGSVAGGWDHRDVLSIRSRFTVTWRDGRASEVYMPDHVCPACWNDGDNHIDACSRLCGACGFSW